ncbi:MAG TPA: hypothetical protein VG389_12435 [Myxococcota bacterium]|nr:hypothetical protein [Myxococcota bacterium]
MAAVWLAGACATSGRGAATPSAPAPHGAIRDPFAPTAGDGGPLPHRLGLLTEGETLRFDEPGAGIGIEYMGEHGIYATVYVYDMELAAIPDGIESDVARAELERSLAELAEMERIGRYHGVKVRKVDKVSIGHGPGSLPAFLAELAYEFDGVDNASWLLLTALRGNFVKVRFTYPAARADEGERALLGFVDDLAVRLREIARGDR